MFLFFISNVNTFVVMDMLVMMDMFIYTPSVHKSE